jgi:hypothetical protein
MFPGASQITLASDGMVTIGGAAATRAVPAAGHLLARMISDDAGAEVLLASSQPTAERYRNVAERYRERGVLDAAYRNFNRAIALNPRDGAAKVWRESGETGACQDSPSAMRTAPSTNAPRSGSARNTYGTVMQALGRMITRARPRGGELARAAGGIRRQQFLLPRVRRRATRHSHRDMPEGARTRPDNDDRTQQPVARVRGDRADRSRARGVRECRRSRQRAL